jgi:hypothetical protein
MPKKTSAESRALLDGAMKQRPTAKNWFNKLDSEQQKAILAAYAALPESGATVTGLARAIAARYKIKTKETAIRQFLRTLDRP